MNCTLVPLDVEIQPPGAALLYESAFFKPALPQFNEQKLLPLLTVHIDRELDPIAHRTVNAKIALSAFVGSIHSKIPPASMH